MQILAKSNNDIVRTYTEREQQRIAIEVYLTNNLVTLRYGDLFKELPEDTVSKTRLLNWLNDYERKAKEKEIFREGAISLYLRDNPSHFTKNGKWDSNKYGEFIEYVFRTFKNEDFFKGNKKVYRSFQQSIHVEDWYYKAVGLMGLKLLESLFDNHGLTSEVALNRMYMNFQVREDYRFIISAINSTAKNYDEKLPDGWKEEVESIVDEMFTSRYKTLTEIYENHNEFAIFYKYREIIENRLLDIYADVLKGETKQLLLF